MNIETLSALADTKIQAADVNLKDFKCTHLALFKEKGFQEIVQDSYKFTAIEKFFSTLKYEPKTFEGTLPESKVDFPTLTFMDGEIQGTPDLPQGLKLKKMRDHFQEVKHLLTENNALSHLHHSFFGEGLILEVEKNRVIDVPVRILNLLTKSTLTAPTHLIVANTNSQVTILEETLALDLSHAQVCESYIMAHAGSHVEHIFMDQEAANDGLNHGSVFAEVEKDATVKSFIFHTSGYMNRKNLTLNLNAPGSNGESYSLFLTAGHEHSDISTVINHKAPDTTSSQIAKGILDGESKGVFTGKIHIHPKAQRVASSQLNKNLLLSKKAQVHSQPQLEIFADDVKCSHGSTTGQLSPDEVFYFQARGIPEDKARTLLAHGFGLEVVQKIQNKEARAHISAIVMKNLETKFSLGGAQ
jgi:Fe-S cluster assembly protein SufD